MTLEEAKNEIKKLDSGSMFFSSDYEAGWEDALRRATEILEQVDTVPVPKDTMTLTELAQELRKIFKFKYLTYSNEYEEDEICLWQGRVAYIDGAWNDQPPYAMSLVIDPDLLSFTLGLSEYADESGVIDYSRCIVEVSNDID